MKTGNQGNKSSRQHSWLVVGILLAVLFVLFFKTFTTGMVHFANDSPLGVAASEQMRGWTVMTGIWNPLNWAGNYAGAASPGITGLLRWLAGPVTFYKFYVPFTLLFVGVCAWIFLRSLKLSPTACVLGGLAAALNSDFLSTSAWGVGSQTLTFGLAYLALAALVDNKSGSRWLRTVLAGSAVGIGLIEGADIGAIFSLFVAAFVVYQAIIDTDKPIWKRAVGGGFRTAIVAVVSAVVAFHTINSLVGTQVQGVAGMTAEERSSEEQWNWATQWSLPKKEVASFAVAGLYGYRLDTRDGGNYWGAVGRQPGWEEHRQGSARFIGSGFYAGVLVVVIALWAFVQSLRRKDSVFEEYERRWVWFWSGMALLAVLLAFGRYAPFYQFVYALPFFSTIRNPTKFAHVANWALVVLFAYGVNGLLKAYTAENAARISRTAGSAWQRLSTFDQRWMTIAIVAFIASCVGWFAYAGSRTDLEAFLIDQAIDARLAPEVAEFSIAQLGWFAVLLGIVLAVIALLLSGFFKGSRARWAGVLLGVILVFDLGRASQPYIVEVNYEQKYASNPVLDFLRDKPYEQRVAGLPFPAPPELSLLGQLYRIEWHQHHFRFYNIQGLDIVQMPRMPEDIAAFDATFPSLPVSQQAITRMPRRWELTNTRYLLGPAAFVEALNTQVDGGKGRFRIAMTFDIAPKPGVVNASRLEQFTAVPSPTGPYAVIEFTGALPRAGLYTNWQVETNDAVALELLASEGFNPAQTVLVSSEIEAPSSSGVTNAPTDGVGFVSYAPKHVVLRATNDAPSILLLNDKYDPGWNLEVDGEPAEILRCNVVMRGVFLEPGEHEMVFRFKPPVHGLHVTVASIAVSLLLLGILVVTNTRGRKTVAPKPADNPAKAPSGGPENKPKS